MTEEKKARKRPVRKSVPAKAFGQWFRCPRCQGRSIIFQKREGTYSCRRCGAEFTVNWEGKLCLLVEVEGGTV